MKTGAQPTSSQGTPKGAEDIKQQEDEWKEKKTEEHENYIEDEDGSETRSRSKSSSSKDKDSKNEDEGCEGSVGNPESFSHEGEVHQKTQMATGPVTLTKAGGRTQSG